ncbi:MAG: MarC family protein, partial [Planctomycetota bacterium]|nr:MarC family protein [Planctomycetota bacterium]
MLEAFWLKLAEAAHIFLLCFVPLFVAMDPITAIPIYLGLTNGLADAERRRIARNACLTALVIALLFLALGEAV